MIAVPALAAGKHEPVHKKDPKVCLVFTKYVKWEGKVLKYDKFFWIKKSKAKLYVKTNGSWNLDDPDKWFGFKIIKKSKKWDTKFECHEPNKKKKYPFELPLYVPYICHYDPEDGYSLYGPKYASAHYKWHEDDVLPDEDPVTGKITCPDEAPDGGTGGA